MSHWRKRNSTDEPVQHAAGRMVDRVFCHFRSTYSALNTRARLTSEAANLRQPINKKIIYFPVSGFYLAPSKRKGPCVYLLTGSMSSVFKSNIGC
jgi:hypothetical protein